MRYLLDTSTCIHALKRQAVVIDRIKTLSPDDIFVSSVTLAELWFGARKSQRPESNRQSIDAFLRPFEVLPFDHRAAEQYAGLRLALERVGRPIGERDLLIASIGAAHGLTVVTHNISQFRRVPGLSVEDWS